MSFAHVGASSPAQTLSLMYIKLLGLALFHTPTSQSARSISLDPGGTAVGHWPIDGLTRPAMIAVSAPLGWRSAQVWFTTIPVTTTPAHPLGIVDGGVKFDPPTAEPTGVPRSRSPAMSGLIWVAAAKVAMTPVQHTDGTSVPEYVCAPRLLVWRYADCSPSCSPEVVACTVGLGTYPV